MPRIYTWIYRAFTGPFIASLAVILFILALQMLLALLEKLAGRGLPAITWAEIFVRASQLHLLLGIPIAIMAGALISFGNLAERKELVALKSSGMNPLKLYIPMMGLAACLSLFAFYLSFQAIPKSHQRLWTLVYNIASTKPTMQLQPGRFYQDIDGFAIRVSAIEEEKDMVYDVIIYDYTVAKASPEIIIADSGKLATDGTSELIMWLYDGVRHDEDAREYGRAYFDTLMIRMAMEGFGTDTSSTNHFEHFRFQNFGQLTQTIDSLQQQLWRFQKQFEQRANAYLAIDSLPPQDISDSLKMSNQREEDTSAALAKAKSLQKMASYQAIAMNHKRTHLQKHLFEWHRRIAEPLNCMLFMLLGLSLGILLKKGGLALPGLVALGGLVLAYLLQGLGKDFAVRGILAAWIGAWLPILLLTPPALWLTYLAITDKRISIQQKISQLWRRETY